jgi:hypothetical protein
MSVRAPKGHLRGELRGGLPRAQHVGREGTFGEPGREASVRASRLAAAPQTSSKTARGWCTQRVAWLLRHSSAPEY